LFVETGADANIRGTDERVDVSCTALRQHDNMVQLLQLFITDLVTSYLAIPLTAFVYIPLGSIIVPYLDVFSMDRQAVCLA
jgi:hypothetical protein